MKLYNNSKFALTHEEYRLERGKALDVPKAIADAWLKFDGVQSYAEPKDVKQAEDKQKELEAENKELKAKIAELEKAAKDVKQAEDKQKEKSK